MRAARGVLSSLGLALAALVSAPPARAAEPAPQAAPVPTAPAPVLAPAPAADSATKRFPRLEPPTMSHRLQFGLALLPGTGYRAIFPYQEMINCGQANKRICTSRLRTFLDVQPSFGFASHWDLIVDLRFGLEEDFTGTHEFAIAPGVRYWVDPQEHAKFFATIQAAFDTTAQHDAQLSHNDDVAVRNSNGFMYEVMRNFGVYVQFGETIGFVRWLRFEIDAGLGVQARLP
ncbi:MAG TPA: hypothetical protein VK989_08245 [Polyangia bacterium]|jgi:hypothetical protein|nr:hypothetical protein [Polyangia bacterium]